MKKSLTLILLLMLFSCNSQENAQINANPSGAIIEEFLQLVENDVKDDHINGSVSLVVLHEDNIIASKTFGYASPDQQTIADGNTIYRIGSITKSFTGFLLLKLQEQGILKLDEPIEKYLPEIKTLVDYDKFAPITFRQLASHTSGLDRESRDRASNTGPVADWENKVLAAIPKTSFRNKPGERFRYSNIGYAILGLAISKAAKTPYIDLVKKEIFTPLEMANSYFVLPEDKITKLAQGMAGGPTAELDYELPQHEHEGRGYRVPNGGIYSTPNDMAKFMMACMGHSELLNTASLSLLQSSQTPTERMRSNYSFGFDLYSEEAFFTVGHRGSTPGYSAHFEFEKNSEYGVILMRNYNFGNTNLDLRSNALLRKLTQLNSDN